MPPQTPEDLLAMSDDDFNEMISPPEVEETDPIVEEADEPIVPDSDPIVEGEGEGDPVLGEESDPVLPLETDPVLKGAPQPKAEEPEVINFEEAYKKLVGPIKANGKTIEVRTADEALNLMKQGANYTKKMQAIQPHRKVLMMLENNGLLDEGKLSYLIDLDKKNPDAIKKLLQDSGIDPLDINTDEEDTYVQGNHRVSDEEEGFVTQLEDLKSTPEGTETIRTINTWDQASKEVLWKNPELMSTIHEQRSNGVYDLINSELERRSALGLIPTQVSFLQAYKVIGDELQAKGAFNQIAASNGSGSAPVIRRAASTAKPALKNGDRASAAAPTRSSAKVTKPFINPLAMSDEEFMAEFKDRL